MGRRLYSRQSNGRFRRATLENTFGLSCIWCPQCRIGNPYPAAGEPPETCHDCGAVLRKMAEENGETLSDLLRRGALMVLGICPTCGRKTEDEDRGH